MAQGADLYSILVSYTNKNNSPYIDIDSFLDYLGKSARKNAKEYPVWNKWVQDTSVKFWAEISVLAEEGKCELLPEPDDGQVFMTFFYPKKLSEIYRYADDKADMPFPSEDSLGIYMPENQVKCLSAEYDLLQMLLDDTPSGFPILKLGFSDEFGSALVLSDMIPRQLTEIAILKIRNYLHQFGNKEYAFHKLVSQLQGKESFLKDQLEQIMIRPVDLFRSIEESGELSSIFWAHFCGLIKSDISKKKERIPKDFAAYQSAQIIEVVNGYYRSLAIKRRDVEAAYKNLENQLARPPYLYTMEQILKLTSPTGGLLTNVYTAEQLGEWIEDQITESKNGEFPRMLIVKGSGKEEQFLLKEKMLPLCAKLLATARILVKSKISKSWSRLIYDFKSEPAMLNDNDFEKALLKLTENLCPDLVFLLADPRFSLVYEEMESKENGVPPGAKVFDKGKLLPYSSLLFINRKELLAEVRAPLPFWYSLPIISSIVKFFKNLSKKSKKKKAGQQLPEDGQVILEEIDRAGEIRIMAEGLELDIVPPGYSVDLYLEELEDRWSRLLNREARENLISDTRFLIRENLRRTLKIEKQFKPTKERINQLAENIVAFNKALSSLSARDQLILYIELYIVRLLVNIR